MSAVQPLRPGGIPFRWWGQITALALMILELLWLVPWYLFLSREVTATSVQKVTLVFGLIMFLAYLIAHVAQVLNLKLVVERIVNVGFLFLGLWLGVRSLLPGSAWIDPEGGIPRVLQFAALALIWAWWRGAQLGQDLIHPRTVRSRMVWGLALLLLNILVVAELGQPTYAVVLFSVYLFTGLSALLFARVSYVGLVQRLQENPFTRRWLFSSLLLIGSVVLIALFVGSIMIGQPEFFIVTLGRLFYVLTVLFWFIVLIPFILAMFVLETFFPQALIFLQQRLANWNWSPPPETPLPAPETVAPNPVNWVFHLALETQLVLFWIVVAILVVVLVWRRQRLAQWWRSTPLSERETLQTSRVGLRQLRKTLQDLADGLFGRNKQVQPAIVAERVRQIYIEVLDLCEKLGGPRPPARTPMEYLPVMRDLFNDLHDELSLLTVTYQQVRYGKIPETEQELQRIEAAWSRVQALGARLLEQKEALEKKDKSEIDKLTR